MRESKPKSDTKKRFYLSDIDENLLGENNAPLIFIGINPSTADKDSDDSTTKRISGITKEQGKCGWIIVNICPLRYTCPRDLKDKYNSIYDNENLEVIKSIFNNNTKANIICAWGNSIEMRSEFINILKQIEQNIPESMKNKIFYLTDELTKKEHPKHPLVCAKKSLLTNFNLKTYIDNFYKK